MISLLFSSAICQKRRMVASHYNPYQKVTDIRRTSTFEEVYKSYNKYLETLGGNPEGHEGDDRLKAYQILADSNMRRIYDIYGLQALAEVDANPKKPNMTGVDLLYKKNDPLKINAYLTIEDFYTGKKLNYEFYRKEICQCQEKGYNCDACKGKMTRTVPFKFTIDVKPGTPSDKVYTFKGACDTSPSAGGGDLEIQLKELPNANFRREMYNLIAKVQLSRREARSDWEKEIKLPNNNRKIIRGSELEKAVIQGEGFPIPGSNERGDLVVVPVLASGNEDL